MNNKKREFWICKEDPYGKVRVSTYDVGGHEYMIHVREVNPAYDEMVQGLVETLEQYMGLDIFEEDHMQHYRSFAREALAVWEKLK